MSKKTKVTRIEPVKVAVLALGYRDRPFPTEPSGLARREASSMKPAVRGDNSLSNGLLDGIRTGFARKGGMGPMSQSMTHVG
jgi:hypothetical protein